MATKKFIFHFIDLKIFFTFFKNVLVLFYFNFFFLSVTIYIYLAVFSLHICDN